MKKLKLNQLLIALWAVCLIGLLAFRASKNITSIENQGVIEVGYDAVPSCEGYDMSCIVKQDSVNPTGPTLVEFDSVTKAVHLFNKVSEIIWKDDKNRTVLSQTMDTIPAAFFIRKQDLIPLMESLEKGTDDDGANVYLGLTDGGLHLYMLPNIGGLDQPFTGPGPNGNEVEFALDWIRPCPQLCGSEQETNVLYQAAIKARTTDLTLDLLDSNICLICQ